MPPPCRRRRYQIGITTVVTAAEYQAGLGSPTTIVAAAGTSSRDRSGAQVVEGRSTQACGARWSCRRSPTHVDGGRVVCFLFRSVGLKSARRYGYVAVDGAVFRSRSP